MGMFLWVFEKVEGLFLYGLGLSYFAKLTLSLKYSNLLPFSILIALRAWVEKNFIKAYRC